jgi:23S rRNA (guanosine2251-2'-O)-methyltransferase
MGREEELIVGRNAVYEALLARRRDISKIYIAAGSRGRVISEIRDMARRLGIPVQLVERKGFSRISGWRSQGVAARVSPKEYVDFEELVRKVAEVKGIVVVLDRVQDPMNLGAIIRSVEASGAGGVIIPRRGASPLTYVVEKASAGALEYVPVAAIGSMRHGIEVLKGLGFWVLGVEVGGRPFYEAEMRFPLAIVLGGEGEGIRRTVLEMCDEVAGIPMAGYVNSINVSVAAGIILYEAMRRGKGGYRPSDY